MSQKLVNRESSERLLKVLDALVLFSSFAIMSLRGAGANDSVTTTTLLYFAMLACFGTMLLIRTLGFYEPVRWLKWFKSAAWSSGAAITVGAALAPLSYALNIALPPAVPLSWSLCAAAYIIASRFMVGLWARAKARQGRFHQRIAIVGGGQAAEDALRVLENSKLDHIEIVGLFDDRYDTRSPDSIRKHNKLGRIADLAPFARLNRVDLIIVAIPMTAEKRLLQILKRLWELPVDIRISAESAELKLSHSAYSYLGDLPLLNVFERPLQGWSALFKNTLDRIIAILALIIFAPVMACVALAVKWESKGPVIFKQKRYGFNNELIEIFKFRSMYTDRSDAAAANLVTKDDPRVTKTGRFIRKSSLDELPQLFNVLLGQLSLVGPRPHALQAKAAGTLYDEVVDGYFARHRVKPGITGWAQINGWRGETDTREKLEQRVKHDLEYIDKWSLFFDLYILAKTPISLLKTENAY
jgi:Undecaprenyl-phosphate glucose phosphotransferase